MDENPKDQDVLLVKEDGQNELKVVAKEAIDKNGKLKTVNPADGNNPDFLRIDKHGNVLENFFANFMRQVKDPTRFQFFRAPLEKVKEVAKEIAAALKNPETAESKKTLETHKVDPKDFVNKQGVEQTPQPQDEQTKYAVNPNGVDWEKLEAQWGVKRETLEKSGQLDRLLNWQKTDLLPVTAKFDETTLRTDARLSLRSLPDGGATIAIHAIRKEPELERPYFGIRFTEEDKQKLLTSGNLGRVAEAEYKQGEKTPVFISLDKQTNELVAIRTDKVSIPETIKGVKLSDEQRADLALGKAIRIEDMTSNKGTKFSAGFQFNADKRGFEFLFDNAGKQGQNQTQTTKQGNTNEPPATFRGKELTAEQRGSLGEGRTVYVSGLEDKKGKQYSGYVTLNRQNGKLDFMFPNAYKEALQAGRVVPDNRHRTQIAVNSEGKTNEATKHQKEPLKQGQEQPKPKKSKGMKM